MKKRLEADLISIAHRILQLKNKSDVNQLFLETQKLYEKLSVLRFVEEQYGTVKPTIGHAAMIKDAEAFYDNEAPILDTLVQDNVIIEPLPIPTDIQTSTPVTEASTPIEERTAASPALDEATAVINETIPSQETHTITDGYNLDEEQHIEEEIELNQIEDEEVFEETEEEILEEHDSEILNETTSEVEEDEIDLNEEEENEVEAFEEEDQEIIDEEDEEESEEDDEVLIAPPAFTPNFTLSTEEEDDEKIENIVAAVATPPKKAEAIQISFEDLLGTSYNEPQFVKVENVKPIVPIPVFEPIKVVEKTIEENVVAAKEIVTEKATIKAVSLNDKLSKGIEIDLNDQIAFVKHLFGNSREDYNRVMSQLITFDNFYETKDFIDQMVKPDYNEWKGKDDYEERFMDIIEKKFL
ncbi:hypothetical protein [Flavobacterium sp. 7A]|uniref:hypothetical protein n=1 Tax=Flavobacterium sp. 7A TaxID=2940571 RepID=UPI002226C84D|nr:hypothetical protein [Flavobacterium sp. 7A]MCW2119152.1 hypothetical protein [Flavobacterium sp. 7A]